MNMVCHLLSVLALAYHLGHFGLLLIHNLKHFLDRNVLKLRVELSFVCLNCKGII